MPNVFSTGPPKANNNPRAPTHRQHSSTTSATMTIQGCILEEAAGRGGEAGGMVMDQNV